MSITFTFVWFRYMKKIFILPVLGLILGAVAIATEIKTGDLLPAWQPLSPTIVACIKTAVDTKETAFLSAATDYQAGYITALTTRKAAVLAAWDKTTKKDIKSALSQASKTYNKTIDTLKKILKNSQKATKIAYKTDVRTCKSTGLWDLIETFDEQD